MPRVMSELRKVRIVNDSSHRSPLMTKVHDGETGELLRNVIAVEVAARRDELTVNVHLLCEVEYAGPAGIRRWRIKADGSQEEIVAPEGE